jgi:hypothetical protein
LRRPSSWTRCPGSVPCSRGASPPIANSADHLAHSRT